MWFLYVLLVRHCCWLPPLWQTVLIIGVILLGSEKQEVPYEIDGLEEVENVSKSRGIELGELGGSQVSAYLSCIPTVAAWAEDSK